MPLAVALAAAIVVMYGIWYLILYAYQVSSGATSLIHTGDINHPTVYKDTMAWFGDANEHLTQNYLCSSATSLPEMSLPLKMSVIVHI